jgi:hypothetical protein
VRFHIQNAFAVRELRGILLVGWCGNGNLSYPNRRAGIRAVSGDRPIARHVNCRRG